MKMLVFSVQIISRLDSQSMFLAPVVQIVDNQRYPADKYWQNKLRYPLDSAIHPLNNWGQMFTLFSGRNVGVARRYINTAQDTAALYWAL